MALNIAVDLEDVVSAFYPKMCEFMGIKCIKQDIWSEENIQLLNKFHEKVRYNSRFYMNLQMLSFPVDINPLYVTHFISMGDYNLKTIKSNWLAMNGFPRTHLIITNNKMLDLQKFNIDYLVDDNPFILEQALLRGIKPIQFIPPYMETKETRFKQITHLSEIEKAVINYDKN